MLKYKKPFVVFLNFDGPLFPQRVYFSKENNDSSKKKIKEIGLNPLVNYWKMDQIAVDMLMELYKYCPFQLVITSAWADFGLHEKEQIEKLLIENNLDIPLHQNWRLSKEQYEGKIDQIKEWLENNEYKDYLILDHNESDADLMEYKELKKNNIDRFKVVLVNSMNGILYQDYFKIKAIIGNWDKSKD